MEIKEKVSHLKGLMEGMEYDTHSKEGKLIAAIADILDDMAEEIARLKRRRRNSVRLRRRA